MVGRILLNKICSYNQFDVHHEWNCLRGAHCLLLPPTAYNCTRPLRTNMYTSFTSARNAGHALLCVGVLLIVWSILLNCLATACNCLRPWEHPWYAKRTSFK